MSGKSAKKQRQLFRRIAYKRAYELGDMIGNNMKPKPKWVPMKIWLWGLGIFININKK